MIAMKLNRADYSRVMKALKSIRYKLKWLTTVDGGELNRRCSIGYAQLLVRNIMTFQRPSPPYTPRYRTWKFEYGKMGYPAPWRLYGDLVRNIINFRSGAGWMGGIPANVYDQGGKSWGGRGDKGKPKRIAMYAAVNELRRPVFGPTMEEYAQDAWPKQGGVALKEVEGSWR